MGFNRVLRRLLLASATTLALLPAAAPAAFARTNHALIVGVWQYPNLPKSAELVGPKNDAVLVRDYLTTRAPAPFEPANVTVLADDVEGSAGSPTHAAILKALADLAAKAEAGDFVYLQFSGHGTQQPALDPASEQDGLDEVFLPADTGMFKEKKEGIPNGLNDNEIAAALEAIRAKGAFVWVVFDACHSGTATRAVGTGDADEAERKLDPETLGISEAMLDEAAAGAATRAIGEERESPFSLDDAGADRGAGATKGGLVAFFAAQTVETTPEMKLPKGDPEAQRLGLFTYTILSKLAENPGITYRQLAQGVLQSYSGLNRTKPTPLFEGDLDAPVFGTAPGERVLQWPVTVSGSGASLPAGLLHRLAPGSKLMLLPGPGAAPAEALGYVEVRSAQNLTSRVAPVAFGDKPAPKLEELPRGVYARLAEAAVKFELAVARPPADRFPAEAAEVDRVLDTIASDPEREVNLRLVKPGESADLALSVMGEREAPGARSDAPQDARVWFLPPSGAITAREGRRPPSLPVQAGDAALKDAVASNLLKVYRATNLARLAAASDIPADEVAIRFQIRRADAAEDAFEPVEPGTVPVLHPDDEIHMTAVNSGKSAVDVNILYIGSDYTITAAVEPYRLHPGETFPVTGLFAVGDETFGVERMVAILTEAPPQSDVQDLGFLAQEGVGQRAIGGPADGFAAMLGGLAAGEPSRDVKPLGQKAGGRGAVMIFPMETAPRG